MSIYIAHRRRKNSNAQTERQTERMTNKRHTDCITPPNCHSVMQSLPCKTCQVEMNYSVHWPIYYSGKLYTTHW